MVDLPLVPSNPNYRFSTTLENVQYVFDVRWNARDAAWYMDISDAAASPIVYGVKLVLGVVLCRRVTDPRLFSGALYVYDLSQQNLDAGIDDLGARVVVEYITQAEIVAFGIVA